MIRTDWRAIRGIKKPTCAELHEDIKKEIAMIDCVLTESETNPTLLSSDWLDRAWAAGVEDLIYDLMSSDCPLTPEERTKAEIASRELQKIDRSLIQTNRLKTTKTLDKLREIKAIAKDAI